VNGEPPTLLLSGDVMPGRGIDQILSHPGDPRLREPAITDAREYVALAERAHGPIPRPVAPDWPWGDALELMNDMSPDVRIINLETSITTSNDFASGKIVHYRMHPANIAVLTTARLDACTLANNHVLDFGPRGLLQTLDVLGGAALPAVGAGRDLAQARRPAILASGSPSGRCGRVVLCSFGVVDSGIPHGWAAGGRVPGVHLLMSLSEAVADVIADDVASVRRPGDVVVASVHWGSNWGYAVPREHVRFAHRLIDGGVDVVHGHSSHHPRPIEVYRDRLIIYGCGDLINDYEGISGYEEYRSDLRLLYFVRLDPDSGCLMGLTMAPMLARRMRLRRAVRADAQWLATTLTRSAPFSAGIQVDSEDLLVLR
jgi:poly-gamma-glutamate capsule biosynthesis protein CapA/YwtB (metallophosphatase superfamily)